MSPLSFLLSLVYNTTPSCINSLISCDIISHGLSIPAAYMDCWRRGNYISVSFDVLLHALHQQDLASIAQSTINLVNEIIEAVHGYYIVHTYYSHRLHKMTWSIEFYRLSISSVVVML